MFFIEILGVVFLLIPLAACILGVIAFARSFALKKELRRILAALEDMEVRLRTLREQLGEAAPGPTAPQAPPPPPAAAPAPPVPPVVEEPLVPLAEVAVAQAGAPTGVPAAPPTPLAEVAVAGPPREPGESLESRIGKQWMPWVGAVVLFLSAVLFLMYAFENKWIGPTGQVILVALGGALVLLVGERFTSRGWCVLGQCLIGLGMAILYATFFAAFSLYDPPVLSQVPAFVFMVGVTIAGTALAVMHRALPMALMAVLGGLLTPLFLRTGRDPRDALFAYLLLLNLGVLGVAFFRRWRVLDALAMAGTFVLYTGWYVQFYYRGKPLLPALAWLGAFYVVYLALPFAYQLVRRAAIPVERFVMAVVNAGVVFTFAWLMLYKDYQYALGFVALGMAAVYLVLGTLLRRRLPRDARALFGAIVMAVTFLTMAVPLYLRMHGITLAWAIEAPVLLYLGYRYRYKPVRWLSGAVLVASVIRLFQAHWPLHEQGVLYPLFVNDKFASAMIAPVAMGLFAVIHQWLRGRGDVVDRVMKLVAGLAGGLLALTVVHVELGGWLENEGHAYLGACAGTALWALGAIGYLAAGARWRSIPAWGVGAFALFLAFVLGARAFDYALSREHALVLNLRFAACLAAVLVAFANGAIMRKAGDKPERIFAAFFSWGGAVALLLLLSAEAYSYCMDTVAVNAYRAGQMAITVVSSLYASSLLFIGFWRRWRVIRFVALGLFGLSALKLLVVDMTGVRGIYRIVAFLVVGLLIVAASYLYHRLEKLVLASPGEPAPSEEAAGNDQASEGEQR